MNGKTALSGQYSSLAQITDQINQAVINLKKEWSISNDAPNSHRLKLSDGDLKMARMEVIHLLDCVETETCDQKIPTHSISHIKILIENQPDFNEAIRSTREQLALNKILNKMQLNFLDIIVGVLDNDRNELFKKLRIGRR